MSEKLVMLYKTYYLLILTYRAERREHDQEKCKQIRVSRDE